MKEKLLAAIKPQPVQIKVPDWNGAEIYILPATAREAREIRQKEQELGNDPELMAELRNDTVRRHIVDEEGVRVFSDDEEDKEALLDLAEAGFWFVYSAIANPNVMAVAKVKAARKN